MSDQPFDPAAMEPGDKVRYIPDGKVYTLDRRKDDDSGWWLMDTAEGIGDRVWKATGQWEYAGADSELAAVPGPEIPLGELEGDPAKQAGLIKGLNDARVNALELESGQPGSLENAFDALKMMVLLEHVANELNCYDESMLDFEGRRSGMIDTIEGKWREMKEAMEAAERQQRLGGGPVGRRAGVPQRPGRGGVVRPG